MMSNADPFAGYLSAWTNLPTDGAAPMGPWLADGFQFADPFAEVQGADAAMRHFQSAADKLHDLTITVEDVVADGALAYATWRFTFRRKANGQRWQFIGVAALKQDLAVGRLIAHTDHWDAGSQLYARLPILGPIIRLVARRAG